MSLNPGIKLDHYEILEPIGKGGMGEVYRARDAKLERDVAIKVLPDELAHDEERLRRFQREAKLLASLNHPNIAAIYGLEQSGETHYLVLELVPGETLAERIARGPIPVDEALEIAEKITEALEEAHNRGIVHRDLKPANVKLTPDDKVKVLDFGLAKALTDEAPAVDAATSMSPTITRDATRIGVILGTAAYMSPEQAKGKPVDERTDIFAFGSVLFEMLTGRKTFPGDDVSEVLAAVIRAEPDLASLPADAPVSIRRLLRRALAKDARARLADIADARLEIVEADTSPPHENAAAASWYQPRWLLLSALLVALTWLVARNSEKVAPADAGLTRYAVTLPEGDLLNMPNGGLAVSPDGKRLAYVAKQNGVKQLFLRERDRVEAVPIQGTENALMPFFSPDGEWLGFVREPDLWKVSLSGGSPERLAETWRGGASWRSDGTIVFSRPFLGLFTMAAEGGEPVLAAEGNFRSPLWIGDNDVIVVVDATKEPGTIASLDLATGERRIGVQGAEPRLIGDYLVFARGSTLWATRFDRERAVTAGAAVPVLDGIHTVATLGFASYAVAKDGSLTYVPGTTAGRLVIVDPAGETTVVSEIENFHTIRLSPDRRKVAGDSFGGETNEIWVRDLETGTRMPVVEGASPVWSSDGTSIAWAGQGQISITASDGAGEKRVPFESEGWLNPDSWSPDGKWLAGTELRIGSVPTSDIWMFSTSGESRAFRATPAMEFGAMFSPDGKWVAYQSNQSGRFEVYVEPFPGPGERVPVSTDGGTAPVWSPDGSELYFRQDTAVMAASVETADGFRVSTPRQILDGLYWLDPTGHVAVEVLEDGKLLMIETDQANEIHVVLNWVEELERIVPQD